MRLRWPTLRNDYPDTALPGESAAVAPQVPSLGNGLTVPIRAADYPARLAT